MAKKEKVVGIVGLGLIGGSFSFACKAYTTHRVLGIDRDPQVLSYAKAQGAIDDYHLDPAFTLGQCDMVFLALYPNDILPFIERYESDFKDGAVVADFCGIKGSLSGIHSDRFTYVGCHPMAGKEVGGIKNADKDLFSGASMIMTSAHPELEKLYRSVGFQPIVHTTPSHHDQMIGYTSQLPHVLAVAYVLMDEFESCEGFYAGSFKDVSRVARINELLWSELFAENRTVLSDQIDRLVENLNDLKAKMEKDSDALVKILQKSRERMEDNDEKTHSDHIFQNL